MNPFLAAMLNQYFPDKSRPGALPADSEFKTPAAAYQAEKQQIAKARRDRRRARKQRRLERKQHGRSTPFQSSH